jgi:iron complex outermembrane receptor protein
MMMETVLSRSIRLMLASGMMMSLGLSITAQAQDAAATQRVEVTGSSIKRIAAEGALPVTIVTAEEIRALGVTSAVDLIKKLTVVQGATGESASVGGQSYGFSGVSIHNIGESRTLVLLNGRRLAQFGGQTLTGFAAGFDLNAIPLSAIERVEILTDGASALYGADAIAGVVNFITKHNSTDGDITLGYSAPANGAVEKRFSATKGYGSIVDDGFNVTMTFGHDERTNLKSVDRSFADSGKRTFSQNGKTYQIQQSSPSPIPANVLDDNDQLVSPFQRTTGACPAKTFRVISPYTDANGIPRADDYCGYDFVKDLQIYPERKRDSFMASVTKKIGDNEVYADLLLSRTTQVSRIAAVPGGINILAGSALHNKYLLPLGITGKADDNGVKSNDAYYRLADMGQRTSRDISEFSNIVVGTRGFISKWDYNFAYNHSESNVKGYISGYPGALAVGRLTSSGLLDPFVGPGQQSAAANAAIASARYDGYWDGGVSKLDTLTLNGSRELMQLAGGTMMLGMGINFNKEAYESKPSLFAQGKLADPVAGTLCDGTAANPCDQRFGDESAVTPYSASRISKGIFGELILPVSKTVELGAATRLDSYSDFGSAVTAKASVRWTPVASVLVRASVGNGFHAPTVPQVNGAQQSYGVTAGTYACTPGLQATAAAYGAACQPGRKQYDQFASGNASLQPEKSKQATLGIRFEPNSSLSMGADLWHVQIRDVFGQLTENLVFANPGQFTNSWTTKRDTGTGATYLAFLADNQNLGKSFSTGLDLDFTARTKTSFGQLSSQLTVTHMLREVTQLQKNGAYYSALGNYAELGSVSFRTQGRLTTGLQSGQFATSLALNFKSGYQDQETDVQVLDAAGAVTGTEKVRKQIGYFSTWDAQTVWTPSKTWTVTGGILNVFDHQPPFVPSISGANRGQQFGYDDRYYDARGRTMYVNASYKF